VWEGRRLLSKSWTQRAVAREYEFRMMTPAGLIGKTGFFGQGLVFSRGRNFAAAWHAHTDHEGLKRTIACVDEL